VPSCYFQNTEKEKPSRQWWVEDDENEPQFCSDDAPMWRITCARALWRQKKYDAKWKCRSLSDGAVETIFFQNPSALNRRLLGLRGKPKTIGFARLLGLRGNMWLSYFKSVCASVLFKSFPWVADSQLITIRPMTYSRPSLRPISDRWVVVDAGFRAANLKANKDRLLRRTTCNTPEQYVRLQQRHLAGRPENGRAPFSSS
jgi:hypothetical protein